MTERTMQLEIDAITMDSSTQVRKMKRSVINSYAELMKNGTEFPAIVVFCDADENVYWLADGFHRVVAAKEANITELTADVQIGSQRDAILYALTEANSRHGIPLTNKEKRQRIEKLLRDSEWSAWSDREIASRCGVSPTTVGTMRRKLAEAGEIDPIDERTVRRGKDGKTYTMRIKETDPASSEQILLKHIKARLDASSAEISEHVRAIEPNRDTMIALYDLHDDVIDLAKLIEFVVAGMEYELWKVVYDDNE